MRRLLLCALLVMVVAVGLIYSIGSLGTSKAATCADLETQMALTFPGVSVDDQWKAIKELGVKGRCVR